MNCRYRKAVLSLLTVAVSASLVVACSFMSQKEMSEIQQNIDNLRDAKSKLLKDPNDKQALALMLTMLNDRNGINRSNAAAILGQTGEKVGYAIKDEAVPALVRLMQSPDKFDRKAGACALKSFGPLAKAAIPILRLNLRPRGDGISWCAVQALGEIGPAAAEACRDLIDVVKESQSDYLDDRPDTCRFAVESLGKIGPAAACAVPDLEALLDHKNPYFRISLSVSLMRLDPKSQKALAALKVLLQDPDSEIRRKTVSSLEDIGPEAAPAKALVKVALKDSDPDVRDIAARVLRAVGKQ